MRDLNIQVGSLRQALSETKSPLGLFLGAGCPLSIRDGTSPLIPDISALTKTISDELNASEVHSAAFQAVQKRLDAKATIEDYLSFIRNLSQVAISGDIQGLSKESINALELEVCDRIFHATNKSLPSCETPYHNMCQWIRSALRQSPVEIFTPNYDLLIEQALEDLRIPYFDGFVGSRMPFFDPYAMEEDELPTRWVRLWKLHGSINWALKPSPISSELQVCRCDPDQIGRDERKLIHPSHLKYDESRRMPYLAMLDRLKAFLRIPGSRLFICGYSFSDTHLNEILRQGLGANPRAHVFGLLYSPLEKYEKARDLAASRSNLTLLSKSSALIGSRIIDYDTVVDSPGALSDPISLKWEEVDDNAHSLRCQLGDFKKFSELLLDLTGHSLPTAPTQ